MNNTRIAWCDATYNHWIGCTKVSEGCKYCYAEAQNNMYKWTSGWGKGSPRKLTSSKNRNEPFRWARKIANDDSVSVYRIFCSSLSDIFDNEVDQAWRDSLWEVIENSSTESNHKFEWLLLTKRIENAERMMPERWLADPFATDVRLGITAETDIRLTERLPILTKIWASGRNFISVEPMLSPIYIDEYSSIFIDWIICGGESQKGCRPMNLQWAVDLKEACSEMSIPFFMKQLGGFPDKRDDINLFPKELQIREFPERINI